MGSLVVQWLGLHASTAGGKGFVPAWETKISHPAAWLGEKKECSVPKVQVGNLRLQKPLSKVMRLDKKQ